MATGQTAPTTPQYTIASASNVKFPYAENLYYRVGWRMITAGEGKIQLTRGANDTWQLKLDLTSVGLVNQLYRVADTYKLTMNDKFCASSVDFDAQEGNHHTVTAMTFDNENHKLIVNARDMVANTTHKTEMDIPSCTYDITGALLTLRTSQLQPGMKFSVPVANGKKLANVRIEGLGREKITLKGVSYNTIRYETFIFNNVLYRRKGRLLIWVSDDAERIPVQMRFVFGFPMGDVTLELEKVERP